MSNTITIQGRHAPMLHEGGTKHYAVVMISALSSTANKAYHLILKIHGAMGKASRVNAEAFADYNDAYPAYKKAIDAKIKRGYEMNPLEEVSLIRQTYEGVEDSKQFFDMPEVHKFFTTTKLTKNTKMESLTTLLPNDDADEMIGAIEFMLNDFNANEDIETLFRKKSAAEAKKEAKEAQKAAIQAIEEKRSEAYGEAWGSW